MKHLKKFIKLISGRLCIVPDTPCTEPNCEDEVSDTITFTKENLKYWIAFLIFNVLVIIYFIFATLHFIDSENEKADDGAGAARSLRMYNESNKIQEDIINLYRNVAIKSTSNYSYDNYSYDDESKTRTKRQDGEGGGEGGGEGEGEGGGDEGDGRCRGKCGWQWCFGYGLLMILFIIYFLNIIYYFIWKPLFGKWYKRTIGESIDNAWQHNLSEKITVGNVVFIVLFSMVIITIALMLLTDDNSNRQYTGVLAPVTFITLGYLFSTDRKAIDWKLVGFGIASQFSLGVFCIFLGFGREIFICIGDLVVIFLDFSKVGAAFVYSDLLVTTNFVFAFVALPVIFFFSFCIAIMYHWGAMQWYLIKISWLLQSIMGTTICETVCATSNVFLGMSEAVLLVRPYVDNLTTSEIHSIMVSGFATVAGSVLAAYVSFGASPALLITSSVMAAPGSLALSKLYCPEVEETKSTAKHIKLEKSPYSSVLEAAADGANSAVGIVLGICANLVAFIAFISFLNNIVSWFFYLIGLDDITFELIFSKMFIPLAFIIGVDWSDCEEVAKIIAKKSIINEFVAFLALGDAIKNESISKRSASITTFAICGFANPGSMGIMVAVMSAISPPKRDQTAAVAFRSFIVGSFVCFTSAAFASILLPDSML